MGYEHRQVANTARWPNWSSSATPRFCTSLAASTGRWPRLSGRRGKNRVQRLPLHAGRVDRGAGQSRTREAADGESASTPVPRCRSAPVAPTCSSNWMRGAKTRVIAWPPVSRLYLAEGGMPKSHQMLSGRTGSFRRRALLWVLQASQHRPAAGPLPLSSIRAQAALSGRSLEAGALRCSFPKPVIGAGAQQFRVSRDRSAGQSRLSSVSCSCPPRTRCGRCGRSRRGGPRCRGAILAASASIPA